MTMDNDSLIRAPSGVNNLRCVGLPIHTGVSNLYIFKKKTVHLSLSQKIKIKSAGEKACPEDRLFLEFFYLSWR